MVCSGAATWSGTAPWFPAISASWLVRSSATCLVYFGLFRVKLKNRNLKMLGRFLSSWPVNRLER